MTAPEPVRHAAVLGHPIAHSLSPVLHRAAYAALGLDHWRYEAVDVTEDQLAGFLDGLDESWAGLSLTMPLKKTVIGLLDHVEPLAEVVGAVNTVLLQGGRRLAVGTNTDVHGVLAALREGLAARADQDPDGGAVPAGARETVVRVADAVVLGAGATAASTLAALAQLGCVAPTVHVRSMARAGSTMRAAHRMGVDPRFLTFEPQARLIDAVRRADVVVSTLPPGAADPLAAGLLETAVSGGAGLPGVLLDCAYDPRPTALGSAWTRLGGTFVSGERMLLHQATEQVRLMTGHPAPVEAMENALEAALTR